MPRGVKVTYDDEWIADRWEQTHNWLTLCNEYNEAHGTNIGYNTFKSHCNRELELNYHYSDEQLEWLKENYPKYGRNETCRMFNERFGTTKSAQAIKIKCVHLGLRVTEERLKVRAIENTERYYKLGTIKVIGNMGVCEKTEGGWKRITDKTIGKAPKGYRTIHLDGDIWNNDPSNLRQVSHSICGSMTSNKFWSEHPRITESGLIWCELKQALERRKLVASLYDIDKRLLEYREKFDPNTGEWLNESELDSLFEEKRDKIEQLLLWAKDLRADASAIESEEKSLAERRKYKINLADRIEDHVARELNGEKFETSKVLVKWRMTPPSVEILDASKIPQEYLRTTEEVKPDLNKIKAKLKEYEAKGETVDWAKLKRTNKMSVK